MGSESQAVYLLAVFEVGGYGIESFSKESHCKSAMTEMTPLKKFKMSRSFYVALITAQTFKIRCKWS